MSVQTALLSGGESDHGYTARHLLVLEGLEAVRKRPGMYIGSTDSRGLMHCLGEIIDNAVDEALAGVCDQIEIVLAADGSIQVGDNGRGIPVDIEPKTGLSGVELVMTKLHAGGKFGAGSYAATGGLHGVGASVVNALSARLDVEVDRGGSTYAVSFRRGTAGEFAGAGSSAPFTARSGLRKIKRVAKRVTGTRIRFWPDRQMFIKEARVSLPDLHARARQTAFLVPGLSITVKDERAGGRTGGDPGADAGADAGEPLVEQTFVYKGGISEFCDYLGTDRPVTDVIRLTGTGQFTETVPVLDGNGHLTPMEVERELTVDVALRWGTGYESVIKSFVNIIPTPKGGTHLTGFERALVRTFGDALRSARMLRQNEDAIIKDDVLEGLTAVVTVRLAEPQFEGQTKEVLGTPAASRIVAQVIGNQLRGFLTSSKRSEKAQARALLEKVVSATRTRVAARAHKEAQRRKNALETSSLPAKLADCRSDDVERSELFIVEGDSALGTAKLARNSEFQALLPIRGKILNVQKSSVGDMLNNAECAAIIQVIGAGSGRSFDLDAVRYGKIIFLADADVDGAHIRCLLLTLLHRYMRPLVEAGRVFAGMPPLHRIEVVHQGTKPNEFIYTYTDPEMRRTVADLTRRGKKIREPIQRYKGLGEMDANQLAETTMDPRTRTLRRISLGDIEDAERIFELLMGNDVAPRKEFLVSSATLLDRARIDA
ncbi:MAG TPA: DNA topoisomerase IV subunit B [Actinomycetes bacterium]|nr:DNA topoisomerase IV subunit B [Actinomycetes bacterium]